MKKFFYLLLSTLLIVSLKLNAQQPAVSGKISQTQIPLGAPVIVNLQKAAEYDRLFPRYEPVHDVEQGDDEMEENESIEGNREPYNPVNNNVPVVKYPGNQVQGLPSPAPTIHFTGDSLKTTYPPDIRGAAGLNHIVHTTNQFFKIFTKTGTVVSTVSLATFMASTGGSGFYDPHVVFDPNNNRFIFTCGGKLSNAHSGLFVAASQTSDPTGNWNVYATDATGNTSDLFDYPLLGFNSNWIVVTGNLFANGTTFASCKIAVYDRAAVYNGSSTGAITIFTDASHSGTIAPAATIDNNQPILYMVQNLTGNSGGYGYVLLGSITGPVGAPVYALGNSVGINQPWNNQYINAPQKGASASTYFDVRDSRIGNAVYRNGSLWFVHHVFLPAGSTPNIIGLDWWQVNPATATVVQFGRHKDPGDTLFYFYPGIDVNAYGDVLLSYSVSSLNRYGSAAYSLHQASDGPGIMRDPYIYKAGLAYYVRLTGSRNRWGDYTFAATDPTDNSFWSFSEWASKSNVWGTQIAHVVATPDTICHEPAATAAINVTDTSATFTWSPTSSGTYTFQYRKVGTSTWITVNTSNTSYTINGLLPNTSYEWQVLTHCASGNTSVFTSLATFTTNPPCATSSNFTASPTVFCSAPATVTFSNSSSNASTYLWDFGDGSPKSNSPNPSHTYNTYGKYTVKLVARGCTVDSITKVQYINVDSTIACSVTLPTSGVGPTQTGCAGNLFDSGGPTGNYQDKKDVSITIAPTGASTVTITFNSFAFESTYDFLYVYDGPNTASPILGQFSGFVIPSPVTSTSGYVTIRQTSDDSLNYSGFALTWQCNVSNVAPTANFTADYTSSCTGTINFTDLSTNGPTSWLWDFGDGNTSTLRNPSHTYIATGVYTVKLTATNSHGSNMKTQASYISINLPTPPTANPLTVCSGNYGTVSATGNPILTWFNVPTGGTPIGTGPTYITPPLFSTTTYYVESDIYSPTQHAGPANNSFGTGGYFTPTNYHCEYFDVYSPLTLVSVQVYAGAAGSRTITLIQNNVTLQTVTANVPAGASRVTLNFPVPIGTGYELGIAGTTNLYRNTTGSTYPYTINGLISITGDNSLMTGYYYFFYDWEIQVPPCVSARVPVTVTVSNGPSTSFTYNLTANIGTFTNTTTGGVSYSWDFGDPSSGVFNTSTQANPTHTFTDIGTYYVCLRATDAAGCSKTSCQFVTVLSVGIADLPGNAGVLVFPNPMNNKLTINFGSANAGKKWTMKLSDVLGNVVAEKTLSKVPSPGKYDWDLPLFSPGAYILILQSDNENLIRRIIRQ